jgi:hypothetical protein
VLLGGFTFLLAPSAVDFVDKNWERIAADLPADQRASWTKDDVLAKLRMGLYVRVTASAIAGARTAPTSLSLARRSAAVWRSCWRCSRC